MKNLIFILIFSFAYNFSTANTEPEWGATGHRTIGEIAEIHLSKKAKKEIDNLLNGQGLAFVSTFGDDIKSDDAYDKYYTWHFVNFPFDTKYKDSKKDKRGDIVMGIEHCIEVLKDPNASQQDKAFFLKFLVHLIGDLHQPLHVGRAEDKGGNDIKLEWHRKKTNLHRVWDSQMIEFYNMSYSELVANRKKLSKSQIELIKEGSVLDWTHESQALAKKVYKSAKPEERLGYRYSYDHYAIVLSQLQKSGIRLAKVLNDIYQ